MSQRDWSKLPVRHKGCVNEALGVKYLSMHWRCMLGDAVQRVLITEGISNTRDCQKASPTLNGVQRLGLGLLTV